MNERAAEDVARGLEETFAKAGDGAGEAFSRHLGQAFGSLDKETQGALDRVVHRADVAGEAIGAALIGGISAAAIGLEKIGDTFETINRGIMTTTTASGAALDELKSHADALVGSLDTSAEAIGSTMGTLATRLRMTAGTELDTLTKHVAELSDRMGNINVGNLGAGFVQFRVGAAQADDTLASLLQTSRQYAVALPMLVDNLSQFGVVLTGVHLNMEQSAHMMGEMVQAGIPLQQGLMGLEVAANAWSKPEIGKGRDFVTFIRDAAESMEYYDRIGNQVARDDIAVKIFSQRRWEQAEQAAQIYLGTIRQTPDAFAASGDGIDKFTEGTKTLGNAWHEFRNEMDVALQGPATHFVEELTDKLHEFGEWCRDHQQDLSNLFTTASQVAGTLITALMNIVELLGKHPGLIQAAAGAFVAWETIKGVEALTTGLRTISALLTGLPAESATAGAGITAGLAPAIAALSSVASFLALFNQHGSGADPNIGPGGDDRQKRLEAGKSYADSHGGQVPPGYAQWLDKGGAPPPGITMPGAAPGTPFFDPQGRPLNAQGQPFGDPGPGAPYVPGSKSFAPGAPEAPKPPEVGAPGDAPGGLITPGDFDPKKKGAKGHLPQAPEVPYGAGFGAPPQPGESAKEYEHEQAILEARHKIDEDVARLNQLEADNNATADDIQKAKNKLLHDQADLYKTEERQTKGATEGLEEMGAKIDKDFGISKGLPGIAENLTKFLANLAMAPVMGALKGADAAIGGPTFGGHGLIGAAALGGAFGPQYTPEGLEAAGASPGGGPEGRTHTGGRYGYQSEPGHNGGAGGGGGGGTNGNQGGIGGFLGGITAATGSGYSGQMGGGTVNGSLTSALTAAGVDPRMFPLLQGFASTEGNNPSGVPTLGFTDSQAGTSLQGHAAALAAQLKARQSVAGPFPASGSPQEQAAWMARVVGQAGVQSDWQGNRQPPLQSYINSIVSGFGTAGAPKPTTPGAVAPSPTAPNPFGPILGAPSPFDVPHYDEGGGIGVDTSVVSSVPSWAPWDKSYNPDHPTGGGNFNPGMKIDTSHASSSADYSKQPPWIVDWPHHYADGGATPPPTLPGGGVPIVAHEGEHVLTSSDVQALGGQSGVYAMRQSLNPQPGATAPQAPPPPEPPQPQMAAVPSAGPTAARPGVPSGPRPGPSMIGGISPSAGYGSGFQVTGGGLVGVAESLPATAISMGMAAAAAALYGGSIEDLAHYDEGGAVPSSTAGAGGGGSPGGAGGGGSPGSSSIGALIGIGMQEINEGISKGGQAAGALVGGVQQTFGLQQFAQSKQAQSGWVSKLVGGFTGAQPQLPNTAGPKGGTPGLTPEQAASQQGAAGGSDPGAAPAASAGPLVHIENLNNYGNENSLGKSVGDHVQASYPLSPSVGR